VELLATTRQRGVPRDDSKRWNGVLASGVELHLRLVLRDRSNLRARSLDVAILALRAVTDCCSSLRRRLRNARAALR
jgi:hypothetical protein